MPLVDIEISINGSALPDDVVAFLHEADLRVSQFVRNSPIRITGFVPSNFVTVYHALRAITEANLDSNERSRLLLRERRKQGLRSPARSTAWNSRALCSSAAIWLTQ